MTKSQNQKNGQAALIVVLFMLAIMISGVFGVSALALKEASIAQSAERSRGSYFAAEAGLEDAIYRLRRNKNVTSSFSITLNGATASTTVSVPSSNRRTIESVGERSESYRALRSEMVVGSTAINFFYGSQVGDGGLEMDNNSRIEGAGGTIGNVYSNGSADGGTNSTITGDLTVASSTNHIDSIVVYGDARANTITNSNVCGDAYYQTIDAGSLSFVNSPTNPTCLDPLTPGTAFPGSADPNKIAMPISDTIILGWKDDAGCGQQPAVSPCLNTGDYVVTADVSLGPLTITGDLLMSTLNKTLTVTGTIYVQGDIDISNGSSIQCDASFGTNSCIVMADGWIHVSNNGTFRGSGTAGSYIMLLSTSSCDGSSAVPPCDIAHHNGAVDLHNNATGAIFYASDGLINLHNGVNVTEITAYKLRLDNNAIVTYEQGLQNAQFSAGPSGGWNIGTWQEIK